MDWILVILSIKDGEEEFPTSETYIIPRISDNSNTLNALRQINGQYIQLYDDRILRKDRYEPLHAVGGKITTPMEFADEYAIKSFLEGQFNTYRTNTPLILDKDNIKEVYISAILR